MSLATARFFALLVLAAATRLQGRAGNALFAAGWFVFMALLLPELRAGRLMASRRLFGPLWLRRLVAGLAVLGGLACGVMASVVLLASS